MTLPQLTEVPDRHRWRIAGLWILLVGALIASFAHNIGEMWTRWFPAWFYQGYSLYDRLIEGESYYTHGPIVPIVSFLIILLILRHLSVPVRPAPVLGFAVLIPSLLLHLAASLARVNFASGFAMIGVLVGLVLVFWGRTAMLRLWFPILFLLFMVPLPEVTISQWNFRLKMVAAEIGVGLANAVGIIVERSGNRVHLVGDKSLVIANVCNGLRTLISLLAFGALYVYVCKLKGAWRWLLFGLAIPVAVIANSIRIVGLILVADIWDAQTAAGWWHDTSGILIFVLAFLLMFGLERLILWLRKVCKRPAEVSPLFENARRTEDEDDQWSRLVGAAARPGALAALILVLLTTVGAVWLNRTAPPENNRSLASNAVPRSLEIDGRNFRSHDMTFDDRTLTILETRDYLFRRYVAPGTEWIGLAVIFSEDNRKGTHPPDVCLEGIGEEIVAKYDLLVDEVPGRDSIACRELIVRDHQRFHYFLYTYKCGQEYTDSFWQQQLTIFWNGLLDRNASGALIEVSTPFRGEDLQPARDRCIAMLRAAVPHMDKNLP